MLSPSQSAHQAHPLACNHILLYLDLALQSVLVSNQRFSCLSCAPRHVVHRRPLCTFNMGATATGSVVARKHTSKVIRLLHLVNRPWKLNSLQRRIVVLTSWLIWARRL